MVKGDLLQKEGREKREEKEMSSHLNGIFLELL